VQRPAQRTFARDAAEMPHTQKKRGRQGQRTSGRTGRERPKPFRGHGKQSTSTPQTRPVIRKSAVLILQSMS
jgi:hypothetical protein